MIEISCPQLVLFFGFSLFMIWRSYLLGYIKGFSDVINIVGLELYKGMKNE
jgi:hypothetical protein